MDHVEVVRSQFRFEDEETCKVVALMPLGGYTDEQLHEAAVRASEMTRAEDLLSFKGVFRVSLYGTTEFVPAMRSATEKPLEPKDLEIDPGDMHSLGDFRVQRDGDGNWAVR